MFCRKCGGRVVIDRVFSEGRKFDVACLICGKRGFVDRDTNAFGRWLQKREGAHKLSYGA